MESPNPLIEMAGTPKKPEKPEKSPEQARIAYEKRFKALTSSTQEQLASYKSKLEDGSFEDKEGEPEGTGDIRKEEMQGRITYNMDRIEDMKEILESGEEIPSITNEIQADYSFTNPKTNKVEKQETITLDIEKKLEEYLDFYAKMTIDIPQDFEENIRDIWMRNSDEIQKAIEEKGFDDILIVPANIPLDELSKKMKMDNGYYDYIKDSKTVPDLKGIPLTSTGVDKQRIILVHNAQNLSDHPELAQTKGKKAQDLAIDESLSLDDYIVFQKKYNEETTKHLDEDGWTWLPRTKSGSRFVGARWRPTDRRLYVTAYAADDSYPNLGCRPSRYFT